MDIKKRLIKLRTIEGGKLMCRFLELLMNYYKKRADFYYNKFPVTNNTFSVILDEFSVTCLE